VVITRKHGKTILESDQAAAILAEMHIADNSAVDLPGDHSSPGRLGPPEQRRQQPYKASQLLINRSDQFCGIVHAEPPVGFGFVDYSPDLRLTYFADNFYTHTMINDHAQLSFREF
jgi:hypothetical protein